MRLFIAVDIPGAIRDRLGALVAELRKDLPGPRWVRPEGMHLTLKFLGEVPESALTSLGAEMRRAVDGSVEPFEIVLSGIGTFPERGRPRVLWLGLSDPQGRLAALQTLVERAVEKSTISVKEEARPFRPHLTLARFGEGRPPVGLAAILDQHRAAASMVGAIPVSSVRLIQSLLKPDGAEYRTIEEYQL